MSEKEYIERDAVLSKAGEEFHFDCGKFTFHDFVAVDDIKTIPAADVSEVRHGEWRKESNSTYVCSCCSDRVGAFIAGTSNYCPNCGAKMDGVKG